MAHLDVELFHNKSKTIMYCKVFDFVFDVYYCTDIKAKMIISTLVWQFHWYDIIMYVVIVNLEQLGNTAMIISNLGLS